MQSNQSQLTWKQAFATLPCLVNQTGRPTKAFRKYFSSRGWGDNPGELASHFCTSTSGYWEPNHQLNVLLLPSIPKQLLFRPFLLRTPTRSRLSTLTTSKSFPHQTRPVPGEPNSARRQPELTFPVRSFFIKPTKKTVPGASLCPEITCDPAVRAQGQGKPL